MRCPKCQYISFDSTDRCRNCGYEFSLTVDAATDTLDLPIQTGDEAIGPLSDFALADRRGAGPAGPRPAPDPVSRRRPALAESFARDRAAAASIDLPLFENRAFDDAPLVTPPAVPRAPLAVRRSSPMHPRAARPLDEPELDLEDSPSSFPPAPLPHTSSQAMNEEMLLAAPAGPRLLAAAIDAGILGSIAAVVLYFTLKVCGLTFGEIALLPRVPFVAFLLLVGGGYFVLFTAAGGQTIGKMAAGIKVVTTEIDTEWDNRVPPGRAVLRAVGYLVSLLPAGLGFLPALIGSDRRTVHDRLADTRVVKA